MLLLDPAGGHTAAEARVVAVVAAAALAVVGSALLSVLSRRLPTAATDVATDVSRQQRAAPHPAT